MYLKYLQIINYKNLKSTRFEFLPGSNTIIGENDSGKSNAMTALRILLDDTYYYNPKRLKESDFSDILGNWRGHWIIISAYFDGITSTEQQEEICKEITPEIEDEDFLKSYIRCDGSNFGTVTLFIRPEKAKRKELFEAQTPEEFKQILSGLTLSDYDFSYTARSQQDFTNPEVYKNIVGDISNHQYCDPDNDDSALLGISVNILDIWKHVSVVFIDALRDVQTELHKQKSPIRRIFDTVQSEIEKTDIDSIRTQIQKLNTTISNVKEVANIGDKINDKLREMIGMVYSPNISLESQLKDDMVTLSKYLTVLPSSHNDIDELGLGHLNIIYIALKLVEFEFNRHHELLNIMIIEEPEAHIHTHIQKTLFENLGVSVEYTQVLMTTHSTHLSEASEIQRVNVLKMTKNISTVMHPTNGLDFFGKNVLKLKAVSLAKSLERYLDAKRSVLLFSKGVILVEGDGEEILIPNLVKKVLGITLDEIGVGLINVGSVGFENIACIFDEKRLQRNCAIITDSDVQIPDAKHQKSEAEKRGKTRKVKLGKLFADNKYVNSFYAPHTLEIDFADISANRTYITSIIDITYQEDMGGNPKKTQLCKELHKKNLNGTDAERYDTLAVITNRIGKGWYATLLADQINSATIIPDYILEAIAFASLEIITQKIKLKMVRFAIDQYEETEDVITIKTLAHSSIDKLDEQKAIKTFCNKFPDDMVSTLIKKYEKLGV